MQLGPMEVWAHLKALRSVLDAVVTVRRTPPERPDLVAHVVAERTGNRSRRSLIEQFPRSGARGLVQARRVTMDRLPLTAHYLVTLDGAAQARQAGGRGTGANAGARGVVAVAFVSNTTHGLDLIAAGLGLAGDEVVLVPWMLISRTSWRGEDSAALRSYPSIRMGAWTLTDTRRCSLCWPKVVARTHCSNVTGIYEPVEAMAALARDHGAVVVVDAAQWAPHRRLHPGRLGAFLLVFSVLQKMLGPTGVGVVYGRESLLEDLQPSVRGGGTVDWVTVDNGRLRRLTHHLEAGTPTIAVICGFGAACHICAASALGPGGTRSQHRRCDAARGGAA